MPTKRTRVARGLALTDHTVALLGLGLGMNRYDDDELHALWALHGAAVTKYWETKHGRKPFAAIVFGGERAD